MAARKGGRSSKTEHVLNLLSHPSSQEPAAPTPEETPPPSTPSAVPAAAPVSEEPSPQRHLSPPILEVARTNNEALEATIHTALEQALEDDLATVMEDAPKSAPPASDAGDSRSDISFVPEPEVEPEPEPALPPEANPEPVPEKAPDPEPEPAIPEPEASSPSQKPEPEAAPDDDHLPDGARFVNVMELLVEEKLGRYVEMFHLCSCPRCLADAKALALSRLMPKYVVLPAGAYAPMLNLYRAKFDSTVTAQIIYACKQVMESPRHQLP